MSSFSEANQVRLKLKMKLSQFAWYHSSHLITEEDGFAVVIKVNILDNSVRKIVSPVMEGVAIKTELEGKKGKHN